MISKISYISPKKWTIPKNLDNLKYVAGNFSYGLAKLNFHKRIIDNATVFNYHIVEAGEEVLFPNLWPENYIYFKTVKLVKKIPQHKDLQGNIIPETPAYQKKVYAKRAHFKLDKLVSGEKGDGAECIKILVRKSLNCHKTKGRVILNACCIDGKTSPAGFYYKLGFRFNIESWNRELENWLKFDGKPDEAPFLLGNMYLPSENIEKCLNYKK